MFLKATSTLKDTKIQADFFYIEKLFLQNYIMLNNGLLVYTYGDYNAMNLTTPN